MLLKKGNEVGQLFLLKTALNIHEKGFRIPTAISDCKSEKYETVLCRQAFYLAPKMGRLRPATRS